MNCHDLLNRASMKTIYPNRGPLMDVEETLVGSEEVKSIGEVRLWTFIVFYQKTGLSMSQIWRQVGLADTNYDLSQLISDEGDLGLRCLKHFCCSRPRRLKIDHFSRLIFPPGGGDGEADDVIDDTFISTRPHKGPCNKNWGGIFNVPIQVKTSFQLIVKFINIQCGGFRDPALLRLPFQHNHATASETWPAPNRWYTVDPDMPRDSVRADAENRIVMRFRAHYEPFARLRNVSIIAATTERIKSQAKITELKKQLADQEMEFHVMMEAMAGNFIQTSDASCSTTPIIDLNGSGDEMDDPEPPAKRPCVTRHYQIVD